MKPKVTRSCGDVFLDLNLSNNWIIKIKSTLAFLHVDVEVGGCHRSKIDAIYIRCGKGKVTKTIELASKNMPLRGEAFADYGRDGRLIGVEVLAPCHLMVLKERLKKEKS